VKIAKVKVSVNCPVCYSGSSFDLAASKTGTLLCDDCGFILSDDPNDINAGVCIFCGNEKFYIDRSLAILGSSLVCYVCEAKYKGFQGKVVDKKFDPETARRYRTSEAAQNLIERIKRYNQSSNL
jgi:hypothetical protein